MFLLSEPIGWVVKTRRYYKRGLRPTQARKGLTKSHLFLGVPLRVSSNFILTGTNLN